MEPQKKGLGRGIASLIPVKQESVAVAMTTEEDRSYLMAPIDQIVPNPHQPRKFFDDEKINELAGSIRDKGILHPLVVTRRQNGSYELVSGERRLRAARVAGLTEVPVILRDE